MFTRLKLQNFKAWRDPPPIDLKPLTLVLGVNSAGKTSLLQPLLLLKQTVESPDRQAVLSFGGQPGSGLDLGTLRDIVHGHDLATVLAFRLKFGPVELRAGDETRTLDSVDYEVDYVATEDGSAHVGRMTYFADLAAYGASRQPDGSYHLSAPHQPPLASERRAGRTFEPERSVGFSADAVAALGADGPTAQDVALALTRELQRMSYLGPLRVRPDRYYSWTGQAPHQVGPSGEAAVPVLLANLLRGERDGSNKGELVKRVSEWAQRLGIADSIELQKSGTQYEIVVTIQGQKANLLDVGFGVSQVLPVLTVALFAPEGSMVILEQPELHLHPLAQSALADLLVEVSKERKLQFLVETHSEHLFRRLQTLIAEERLTPDECSLLFVNRRDGESAMEPLRLNAFGRVENWPDKFFGDTAGEVERQMERTIERMERGEQGG